VHSLYLQTILCRARITLPRARTTSQAADNVTVTWQRRTSESKAPSQKKRPRAGAILKRLGSQHASPRIACTMGGVWRRGALESVKAAAKISPPLAPIPASTLSEGDSSYLQMRGFGRPTERPCQGVYDRGAAAHLGQSRYLKHERRCL